MYCFWKNHSIFFEQVITFIAIRTASILWLMCYGCFVFSFFIFYQLFKYVFKCCKLFDCVTQNVAEEASALCYRGYHFYLLFFDFVYYSLYHLFVCLSAVICGNMFLIFLLRQWQQKMNRTGSRVILREPNTTGSSIKQASVLQSDW